MKGYVQVYTGNGKGKTTAALGLALRGTGAGLKVYIAQFVKGEEYSEHKALARLSDSITIKQFGRGFVGKLPDERDIEAAKEGLKETREIMCSGQYHIIILDEANIAVHLNLFSVDDLLDFIQARPEDMELIITGRMADPRIMERADLVTEMKEIKHYYQEGVQARYGIEK